MTALLDTAAIADLLGVSREHVTDKLSKRPDFPRPTVNVSRRLRRWKESEIRAWMAGPSRTSLARTPEACENG